MKKIYGLVFIIYVCVLTPNFGQNTTVKQQIIRGHVIDRTTQSGIAGALIELLNHSPRITAIADENGAFELKDIPVGRQRIRVEHQGYYETIEEVLVVAGKQAVTKVPMDEEFVSFATVEADREKSKERFRNEKMESVDEMNPISTREFNIEEVSKYVGGFNDPA